jgi:glycogen debranching enzyme
MTDPRPSNQRIPSSSAEDPLAEARQRYEVQAGAEQADEHDQVLKHGESFAVFDRHGDIRPVGLGEEGIYHHGTRHLSGLMLRLGGSRPLLLGSTTRADNARIAVDLTNTDVGEGDQRLAHSLVHVSRSMVLLDGACHERLVVRSFARRPVRIGLDVRFEADFADIFEVRGMRRLARGRSLAARIGQSQVLLRYRGLDEVTRRTRVSFSPAPTELAERHARFDLELPDARAVTIDLLVACEAGSSRSSARIGWDEASDRARREQGRVMGSTARLHSSNALFTDWLDRSAADLAMLTTRTPEGPYPYAGVPWFSTPFGRDGLIAALQSLWVAPELARGVLSYLAARQADAVSSERDAQPGKILHEVRDGEMAALGEIPFGRYYGSHDATPLFVMLAAAHWRHTADLELQRRLWPHVERALAWMATHGDPDGDGFLEYARSNRDGLVQQGWKDSADSVSHADGSLAQAPIALCEVQAYAYGAYVGAAELAQALGDAERADGLRARAADLRRRFDEAFWDDELGTYALALDGEKRPCRVVSSNAGHALLTGIALPERASAVASTLMADASASGWGVRTLAAGSARYNPMSYHNGSIWPHDTAMVALGLARYGHGALAARLLGELFDASRHFDLARLPELFCGFTRRQGEGPTRYPMACSPQAWSAGAVFMLLEAALGLEVDAPGGELRFRHAALPEFLDRLVIERLRVGAASVDLVVERQAVGAGVRVVRRRGDVEVIAVK